MCSPRRAVSGDCHLSTLLCGSAQEPLEIESPELPLSLLAHINTTRGDFHGIFCNHSNVSFPIVCQPSPSSTVKAATNTGCFFPRTPRRLLLLPSTSGSWRWQDLIGSAGGIRSVSQLVKHVSAEGIPGATQLSSLGGGSVLCHLLPHPPIISILMATNNYIYRKKPLPQIQST